MKRLHQAAKFFFEGDRKVFLQGVAYGPFRPCAEGGDHLPPESRVVEDFAMMQRAGVNLVRLYHAPPEWFLDRAAEAGLRVITTVPWPLRGLFMDHAVTRREILANMRRTAKRHAGHPAVLGFFVDNEMPADLVRWHGRRRVERFLDDCIAIIKDHDPGALVSYAGYPPSEYLHPRSVDFFCFNVYLHDPAAFRAYLGRLQNIAGEKPLVLGECGLDTIRHSTEEQSRLLSGYVADAIRCGAAGSIIFSWTDEWFTGGADITDWAFGIVDAERKPKPAYHALSDLWMRPGDSLANRFPLPETPRVSVVVCSYNGASTLDGCLRALEKQTYPNFEIIVVDDGSTDNTREILKDFPGVRAIHQDNAGLSVARNVGIAAATGEVVAFTDSDCMPDEDWLYYLIGALVVEGTAAVGGPNISPPAHQWVQAAVAASPGSPSHVLFSDRRAEHVPGCNMAFRKEALEAIGCFDPVYRKAGDDVDVCWKLLDRGCEIAFSPTAVVWHHRRFCVTAYFSQQRGYGEAEALLRFKHLNRFDRSGSACWHGRIYGGFDSDPLLYRPILYYGQFAMGSYQAMYTQQTGGWLALFGSLQWVGLTIFMLAISAGVSALRPVPLVMFGATLLTALVHMARARIERRFDGFRARLLLFYLSFAQPLARARARYFTWMENKRTPATVIESAESRPHYRPPWWRCGVIEVWSEKGLERHDFIREFISILEDEHWRFVLDNGWSDWDVQIFANRWWHVCIRTQCEAHAGGRRLIRVGIHLVTTSFTVLASAVALGFGLSLLGFVASAWPILLFTLACGALYQLTRGWLLRRRVAETVLAATRGLGMRRLEALAQEQRP